MSSKYLPVSPVPPPRCCCLLSLCLTVWLWVLLLMGISPFLRILFLLIGSGAADDVYNVLQYGATGDGVTDDTAAFEAALAAIEAANRGRRTRAADDDGGGGRMSTLLVPGDDRGQSTYLIRPINLTSNMDFHLGANATVLGLPDCGAWPLIEGAPGYGQGRDHPEAGEYDGDDPAAADGRRFTSLLHGERLSNVRVSGEGPSSVVDGQGAYWWRRHESGVETHTRGHLVELMYSRGVEVASISLKDSPFWTTHFYDCDDVHVHHTVSE